MTYVYTSSSLACMHYYICFRIYFLLCSIRIYLLYIMVCLFYLCRCPHLIWHCITGGLDVLTLGTAEVSSRAYCSWFGFRSGDQQKPVAALSGGERNRCQLAKVVRSGANVLLLDEPTNDLDVDTIRSLEEALLGECTTLDYTTLHC